MSILDDWCQFWAAGVLNLPPAFHGMRLVNRLHATVPGTPMYADVDLWGQYIGYNPAALAGMGCRAAFYVFLHELGHHHYQHPTTPLPQHPFVQPAASRAREIQADSYAQSMAIRLEPRRAELIYHDIRQHLTLNDAPESATHPSDSVRRLNAELAWIAAQRLPCDIVLVNDDLVAWDTASWTLDQLGVAAPLRDQVLRQAELHGSVTLIANNGQGWTYQQALALVQQIEQAVSLTGATVPTLLINLR